MPVNILMPALSPTMEEGTLAKWLKKEGDAVASGDILAEIETDKATMEFEATDEGTLGKIVVAEGTEGVKVNDLIAVLLEDGESASDIAEAPAGKPSPNGAPAPAERQAEPEPAPAPEAEAGPANGADRAEPGRRLFASPLARRIAKERGLDLGAITGSGPKGRIVKADVENAAASPAKPAAETPAAQASPAAAPIADAKDKDAVQAIFAGRAFEEVKLDGMRKTIASRLSLAKRTIPHFYLRRDIRIDTLLAFRADLNAQLAERNVKLSVNDFIIKAVALALQQVPECNAVWAEDRILRLKPSDVAVAVAIKGGLLTPVIRDAEMKSLSAISAEMKDLAARARTRKLDPAEYQGGTTAISNLGMMGIDNFDAVINPPQASILAVGAGVKKPVVGAGGEIEVATILSVTLSVDHRVIDGATGAVFLQAIRDNLEKPITMLA